MAVGSPPADVREPVSPELVLVAPPDEARAARNELPEPALEARRLEAAHAVQSAMVEIPVRRRWVRKRSAVKWLGIPAVVLAVVAILAGAPLIHALGKNGRAATQWSALSGAANNAGPPSGGKGDEPYRRVAAPAYADGIKKMYKLPPARYISNRVFNDLGQNLFSENDVSQWGWVWGQFLDHTFGLRNEKPGEKAPIPF